MTHQNSLLLSVPFKNMKTVKDWEQVLREYSDPEDSDAEDDLNVMSVQKNAHRVLQLCEQMMTTTTHTPPMGMNRPDVLKTALSASAREAIRQTAERSNASGTVP